MAHRLERHLTKAASTSAVCITKPPLNSSCTQGQWHGTYNGTRTFTAFGFPRGMGHLVEAVSSSGGLNQELGVDHARIPVAHTHTAQHPWQPGLWFYYMRGCSDFAWDVGRTLLVRNKCHLAIVLEQRAHRIGWAAAVARVARTLLLAANVSSWWAAGLNRYTFARVGIVEPLEAIAGRSDRRRNTSELKAALDACASGAMSSPLVEELLGLNTLDYLSGAILMHELPATFDTIQIANQCESGPAALTHSMCQQAVEIWDVRTIRLELTDKGSGTLPRPWSWPDGTACKLADAWPSCMSCHDSLSERACQYRCTRARSGSPSAYSPQGRSFEQLMYGPKLRKDFAELMRKDGALAKATQWQAVWGDILRKLPRLPAHARDREA